MLVSYNLARQRNNGQSNHDESILMQIVKIVLVSIAMLLSTFSIADHTVDNGGGIAEQNTLYALKNVDHVIQFCIASPNSCFSGQTHRQALEKVLSHLPSLVNQSEYLSFKTEVEDPRLVQDGQRQWFVTHPTPGSPVIVNRDMIYRSSGTGFSIPYTLGEAFSLVMRIVLYQTSDLDPEESHELSVSIGSFSLARNFRVGCCSQTIFHPNRRLDLLNFQRPGPSVNFSYSEAIIKDSVEWTNIDRNIAETLTCPVSETVIGWGFKNIYLAKEERTPAKMILTYKGDTQYHCSGSPERLRALTLEIQALFYETIVEQPINQRDVAFRLDPNAISIKSVTQ